MNCISLTKARLDDLIATDPRPILLDFWAPWCGPCKKMAPIVEAIAQERDDILFGSVNLDEEPELARQFRILSIPTLLVLKSGQVAARAVGFRSRDEILKLLEQ